MSSLEPGVVLYKEHSDSPEERLQLLKQSWSMDSSVLPDVVPPRGLSSEHQWYLHEQIRPFCPEEDKDITCPMPTVPKSSRSTSRPQAEDPVPNPCKRKRTNEIL